MAIRRRAQLLAACACLTVAGRVAAQGVCLAPELPEPSTDGESVQGPNELTLFAGSASGNLRTGETDLTGGLRFSYRNGEVTADDASYSDEDPVIEVLGNVCLTGDDSQVCADDARFNSETDVMSFGSARVVLPERQGRATAESVTVAADRVISLSEIGFTTCPEDDVDWLLLARELKIETDEGFATARGVTLRFKGIPIMRVPRFSFPIDDRRKSGFLTPRIAERDRTGFDLTVPYYINLAPNYDLLLEPRYMGDRGTQLGGSFRYLLPRSNGQLDTAYLRDDRQLDRPRYYVDFGHESALGRRWELTTRVENVSDSAYFEDLGGNLGVISQTHLDRYVDLSRYAPRWSLVTRFQEYQTIDDLIAEGDRPYRRMPRIQFAGRWGDRIVGFESRAETVRFDRTVGDTGWRFDALQELSLRFGGAGAYVTPAVGFRQTSYRIDETPSSPSRSLSRGLPIASLDSGLRFERSAGRDGAWVQTIEPRLLYVRIPYESQSDLPVFDTILPDFNLVQLFRTYQFVGADRVADTNRVSIGLTTRLIESASGRERVSATVGQTRYRNPRRVMLPDETAVDSTRSNYVAELGVNLSDHWDLDVGYQWNGETKETVRTETRFEFRPQDDRLLGLAYRMREGVLEQGDVSMIWPVADRWRLIGQYSYSLLEKKALEQLAGLEYEACCWRFRVTTQRYIVRSTGQTDSTVAVQLELKGLGRERPSPEELLGRAILGSGRLDPFFD